MRLVDDEVLEVLLEIRDGIAEQLAELRGIAERLDRQARSAEECVGILRGEEWEAAGSDAIHASHPPPRRASGEPDRDRADTRTQRRGARHRRPRRGVESSEQSGIGSPPGGTFAKTRFGARRETEAAKPFGFGTA